MLGKIIKRWFSGFAAAVLTVSNIAPAVPTSAEDTPELCYQNIELYPNGEDAEQVVTLDGLMPEGAEAEAVDVSDEHEGIAAYDITITDGWREYQPGEEHPIWVEITDPVITENIQLWHIHDDGEREQIFDFTAEEGKVSFYATGFSVYEIVDYTLAAPEGTGWLKVASVADLANYGEGSSGLYISTASEPGYFFMNQTVTSDAGNSSKERIGIKKTKNNGDASDITTALTLGAVPYYFEKVDGSSNLFYVYCIKNNAKNYLTNIHPDYNRENNLLFTTDNTKKIAFAANVAENKFTFNNGDYYWNQQGNAVGNRFCSYNSSTDNNNYLYLWYYVPVPNDPYELNNKSYGLMERSGSFGYALMADENGSTRSELYKLDMIDDDTHEPRVLYVDNNIDISMWTFISTSEDWYLLKAGDKYLKESEGALTLTDSEEDATEFQVLPQTDTNKTIKLKVKGKDLYISNDNTKFSLSNNAAIASKFNFVQHTEFSSKDRITYTATRISVSDGAIAKDQAKLIVYTRLWDDTEKKYYYYAIDYNGTLRQVQAYGDKIMWLDDAMNTLLWEFTVYHYDDGTEKGFYELRNTHSDKYLAPQITGSQTLSDSTIGISMQSRKYEVDENGKITYGEYYSNIIAWDEGYKQYVALAGDKTTGTLKAVPLSAGDSFYFATMDDIFAVGTEGNQLNEVTTVDNTEYGITMRMANWGKVGGTGSGESDITKDYFGYSNKQTGLLSESLDADGHPTVTKSNNGHTGADFGDAFNDAILTNNLFIESIHDSTGYFEYDSCQNFATLVPDGNGFQQQVDGQGNKLYIDKDGKLTKDPTDATPIYDFTVYRELGTRFSDDHPENGSTRRHGQFLPYNYLKAGSYSSSYPQNLFDVNAIYGDNETGLLDDDDPRKYEKLLAVYRRYNNKEDTTLDYYFGMEMSATFVQTPNGLDAWGHDVIFEFNGDDDFWLYVDGELVLDLGGIHSAEYGKVNFRTGQVDFETFKDGSTTEKGKHHTTLYDIFKAHYRNKKYTEKEAQEKILRENGLDRDITLAEYQALYPTEYNNARAAYLGTHSEASEEQIKNYLTDTLCRRKITYDEYKTFFIQTHGADGANGWASLGYDDTVTNLQNEIHHDEDVQFYLNEMFSWNDEPKAENQGYVFRDYTTHEMKVYYMERGAGASNLHMKFNLSSVTPGNVLFAKTLSGTNSADDMDFSLVQYPFQIFYKVQESDQNWTPLKDRDAEGNISVAYQNSTQTVRYAATYTPAGYTTPYENVFFLTPGKNIEINFPDEAMFYYVVECAVNPDIYDLDNPTANNGTVQLQKIAAQGNLKDLQTASAQVGQLPSIAFDNKVKAGSIRKLNITKWLYDEHYNAAQDDEHRLKYDPGSTENDVDNTMFKFRVAFFDEMTKTWMPADMERYYILDEGKYLVKWNAGTEQYERYLVRTDTDPETQEPIPVYCTDATELSEIQKQDVTFYTSRNGAIDDIPANYTVVIPGVIAGTKFRIEERDYENPVGYELIDFKCRTALFNGNEEHASYLVLDMNNNGTFSDDSANYGEILANSDAFVAVKNRRGFGIEADKVWSDADAVKEHGPIYVAVFKGEAGTTGACCEHDTLVEGTIRQIESPADSVKYFFTNLDEGDTLANYHIHEIMLTTPTVRPPIDNDDLVREVLSYTGDITILDYGPNQIVTGITIKDLNNQNATDDYTVSYDVGEPTQTSAASGANIRKDKINNKRKGGVEIYLNQWNTQPGDDIPLAGGTFEIYKYDGNSYSERVGGNDAVYVSDSSGLVTVLYGLTVGDKYMVKETISPRGFIGMQQPVYFEITTQSDESGPRYILNSWENGNDDDNDNDKTDGKNWAEYVTPSGIMAARVDIYNKPFMLEMLKIDGTTKEKLDTVEFALYKDTMILGKMQKSLDPIAGYEQLITGTDGVIPKIDNTLMPLPDNKYYYLEEKHPKTGYECLKEDIKFTIDTLGNIICTNEDLLEKKEEQIDNTLKVTYTISIPNMSEPTGYYFDVEKIILVDRNLHESDITQKFVFLVEKLDSASPPQTEKSFFITLNCTENITSAFNDTLDESDGKTFNAATKTVICADGYVYPTAIWKGMRKMIVQETGTYRVTEVSEWSSTDYDFWKNSNKYKGVSGGGSSSSGNSVLINVTSENSAYSNAETPNCPTASFTNAETEFAYLSSQAYAENTIKLQQSES